jgi:Secretion system C-terminal sorting domain
MNTQIKFYIAALCLLISSTSMGQTTLEMTTRNFIGNPAVGPTANPIGPIAFERDQNNNNLFTNPTPAQVLSLTASFANQVFTGLTYSNVSTGLTFGASPTTAVDANTPAVQKADPNDTYNLLGSFSAAVGGPTNNMFTSDPLSTVSVQSGTGIIADGIFGPPANGANGAVGVFTAAQVLFNAPGGPALHNSATRYYYGDVVLTFNRFVANPVIHIGGLGGSYRYFPVTGTNQNDPTQWLSTFFTTEIEVQTAAGAPTLTRMSGNQFFTVTANNITNSAASPNGASVPTVGGLFQDLGAASGSFRVNGPAVRTVVLRIFLRGSNASQFPWSTVQANVLGGNRNPFTGDVWWVSVSAGVEQLSPLSARGLLLNAALNGNDVLLKWKTLSESNTDHFEIERSVDGISFSPVGIKKAAGNSSTELSYDFADPDMTSSIYYYRIKLVDFDGKVSYSNVAVVRKSGSIKRIITFPNPAASQINVEFSNAKGNYKVSLYDLAGHEVHTQRVTIGYTVQYVIINRNSLAAGSYFLRVIKDSNNETFVEKIIVQ